MSRIGKSPIPVPAGVEISIDGQVVTVKGPKGTLSHEVPPVLSARQADGQLLVERADDERESRALHGLNRTLLNNLVIGVSEGFRRELEIVGVGYRATAQGPNRLELAVGYSHPVKVEAPEGISFEVPAPTRVAVVGISKHQVGQVAANIRSIRKPEPYKGKGIRYSGERIIRKAGKAGK
jgi:large subunit ribosomal protein L6